MGEVAQNTMGNTKDHSVSKKRAPRSRKFCFTINNPSGTDFKQVDQIIEKSLYPAIVTGKHYGL